MTSATNFLNQVRHVTLFCSSDSIYNFLITSSPSPRTITGTIDKSCKIQLLNSWNVAEKEVIEGVILSIY